MQTFARLLALVSLAACVIAHDDHDHDTQMPLDYVRFPYQAVYPGDNEGKRELTATCCIIPSDLLTMQ